ncbi:MAG: IS110 family transposase [bacterium]|nr:IS110 family transposase [bacterium]
MADDITFVGLDVSKATISVGVAPGDPRQAVHYFGSIAHSPNALFKLCETLSQEGSHLHFCYEAGPFGYWLYRRLRGWGHVCDVVAPSLIPKRPGDRVKTDRRDALSLASLLRAGQLTEIWVPDATHEAVRALVRLRRLAAGDVKRAKQQILSFGLMQERVWIGGRHWTKAHRGWLLDQKFDHAALVLTFTELLGRLERAEAMLARLRLELKDCIADWALLPLVEALQALRGFDWVNATVMVAEIGDFRRFPTAGHLMAYAGLVPSEHSSGQRQKRGAITKAGNAMVRRTLVEAAWTYRFPPRQSYPIRSRSAHLPEPIRDKAWQAQTRLCRRMRQLRGRGKHHNAVLTAVARELAGHVWAIGRMVEPKMA